MPGGTTTSTNQSQASQTAPWAPSQPLLNSILSGVGGVPTSPTAAQTTGVQELEANAASAPNFAPAATNTVNTLLAGGPTNYSGILNQGYATQQADLTPYANGSMVNNNQALTGELSTMSNDITNQVNSEFAAAGRPPGTNADVAQATARGITQGEAPVIAGQYNQDVSNQINAAQDLASGAQSTASGLTGITQAQLANEQAGLSGATAVPGILNQNANSLLQAGTAEQALPYSGYGLLESLVNPIAGLGASSTGTSTGSTTQQQPLGTTLLGGALGGAGILGSTGAFGSAGWLAPLLLSDENVKENKVEVGILNDGTPVWAFNYIGDDTPRIGLMAQEVEKTRPDAVVTLPGGIKAVDYGKATERSRALGILNDLQMAA